MKKWVADFILKSNLAVKGKNPILYFNGELDLNIEIRNRDLTSRDGQISAQLYFQSHDIESAAYFADSACKEFLHCLTLVTNHSFKITRKNFLMDWTPGLFIREAYVYADPGVFTPPANLDEDMLRTASFLFGIDKDNALKTALRWFSEAIHASSPSDQYQYFWFCIEVLAAKQDRSTVVDRCQRCGGDLRCEACGRISEHRPFEKQLIASALQSVGTSLNDEKLFFDLRNMIAHGAVREELDKRTAKLNSELEFVDSVNALGERAYILIMKNTPTDRDMKDIVFVQKGDFLHYIRGGHAHLELGIGGDPANPKYENVHLPLVTWQQNKTDNEVDDDNLS